MNENSSINWVVFGQEVVAARAFLSLSREGLAREVRLAPATIARIESGDGPPIPDRINAAIQVQNFLEKHGIEFPEGTRGRTVKFNPGELTGIAVCADPSMPNGCRWTWGQTF